MNVESLIADLSRRGIRLIAEGDSLIVEPASKLTNQNREFIRHHKPGILAKLAELERNRWPAAYRHVMPLRRCGALVCPTCHVHSPSGHNQECIFQRFESCR